MDADLADVVHLGRLVEHLAILVGATQGLGDHRRERPDPLHVGPDLAVLVLGGAGQAEQGVLVGPLEGAEGLVALVAHVLQLPHQAVELGTGGGGFPFVRLRSARHGGRLHAFGPGIGHDGLKLVCCDLAVHHALLVEAVSPSPVHRTFSAGVGACRVPSLGCGSNHDRRRLKPALMLF